MRPSRAAFSSRETGSAAATPSSRPVAEPVLACRECDDPLERLPSGGYHCLTCDYPPSMQDTYIFYRCPDCGTRLTGNGEALTCSGCGTEYRKK
ncbi:hypothetical protein AMJ57_01805 [Parcubacteria bacterium SG8_24]|nr:MAG: hypothetical protein AMJ57_01805 [Parcubacteria bacterium SG8_24]